MEREDDPEIEATEASEQQHTRGHPPATRGGLASTAGDDMSGGISMSGAGQAPDEQEEDALDQIVEGGARLGWGGVSQPTDEAAEARDRALGDVDPDEKS